MYSASPGACSPAKMMRRSSPKGTSTSSARRCALGTVIWLQRTQPTCNSRRASPAELIPTVSTKVGSSSAACLPAPRSPGDPCHHDCAQDWTPRPRSLCTKAVGGWGLRPGEAVRSSAESTARDCWPFARSCRTTQVAVLSSGTQHGNQRDTGCE